ncbi:MAG: hypothetical protein WEB09_06345, partial [Nitriliruptor sp.]
MSTTLHEATLDRPRTPLTVDLDRGSIRAGRRRARFDPAADDAAYLAYLGLVRRLRGAEREPTFVLRRDDIEVLAAELREDAVTVLERLGDLMGVTVTQRRSMVTSFLTGAVLIAVASGATALGVNGGTSPSEDAGTPVADVDQPVADGPSSNAEGEVSAPEAADDEDAAVEAPDASDAPAGTAEAPPASAPAPAP